MNKQTQLFIGVGVVAAALAIVGFVVAPPGNQSAQLVPKPPTVESFPIHANLIVESSGQPLSFNAIGMPTGSTVYDLLMKVGRENSLEVKTKDFADLGAFVESINSMSYDTSTNKYWIFYVDGVPARVGAQKVTLTDGQTITWRLEEPK